MMAAALSRVGRRTIAETAALLHVSRKTIRNALYEFRENFDPPVYGRLSGHPRRLRLLTPKDVAALDRIFSAALSRGVSRATS